VQRTAHRGTPRTCTALEKNTMPTRTRRPAARVRGSRLRRGGAQTTRLLRGLA
jgi:hypothetical protein